LRTRVQGRYRPGEAAASCSGYPLRAGAPQVRGNKILWVMVLDLYLELKRPRRPPRAALHV